MHTVFRALESASTVDRPVDWITRVSAPVQRRVCHNCLEKALGASIGDAAQIAHARRVTAVRVHVESETDLVTRARRTVIAGTNATERVGDVHTNTRVLRV